MDCMHIMGHLPCFIIPRREFKPILDCRRSLDSPPLWPLAESKGRASRVKCSCSKHPTTGLSKVTCPLRCPKRRSCHRWPRSDEAQSLISRPKAIAQHGGRGIDLTSLDVGDASITPPRDGRQSRNGGPDPVFPVLVRQFRNEVSRPT